MTARRPRLWAFVELFALVGFVVPDKFSALTLDTLYRRGENRLELFVIDDSGGRVRLRPLALS